MWYTAAVMKNALLFYIDYALVSFARKGGQGNLILLLGKQQFSYIYDWLYKEYEGTFRKRKKSGKDTRIRERKRETKELSFFEAWR